MVMKRTTARNYTAAHAESSGTLDVIATVPALKIWILHEIFVYQLSVANAVALVSPYILPSGGTDAGADLDSLQVDMQGGATVIPLMDQIAGDAASGQEFVRDVLPTGRTGGPDARARGTVLMAGDAIKVKRRLGFISGGTQILGYTIWISYEEFDA